MNNPASAICKFPLDARKEIQRIHAPYIVNLLSIQWQIDQPVLWAEVYSHSARRDYVILRYMTGATLGPKNSYIGTVQAPDGTVLHFFTGGNL